MTRFEKEISGCFGEFWRNNAEQEIKKAVALADAEAKVDEDGAIRWRKSGNYLMDDFCEKLEYAGYDFSREATASKREMQDAEFLEKYRKNDKALSDEALAEARATFGEGTTVVNILTGRKTQL